MMQEISSLVGEVRTEASEAETVAMVTATDGEEPMQTESQVGEAEQPSVASVLQVHVEAGEAATAQVCTDAGAHTHMRNAANLVTVDRLFPLSDGDFGPRRVAPGADVVRRGRRGGGARDHNPHGDRFDLGPAGSCHFGRRGSSAGDYTGRAAGRRARR